MIIVLVAVVGIFTKTRIPGPNESILDQIRNRNKKDFGVEE
jgi:hypothetical protein